MTGAAEGLRMQSMMTDLGLSARVRVWTDSNTDKANASRGGLGKTRFFELKYLWLQEVTKSGRVKMKWVTGEQILVDHLTKGRSWCEIDESIRGVGRHLTVSISNRGNEHRWKKWQERYSPHGIGFARGGTCKGREGTKPPAGCPTSAGKPEGYRNSGGVLMCDIVQSGAPRSRQVSRMEQQEQRGRSRSRQHARQSKRTHCWRRPGCDLVLK